jgi:hypothetical protein
MANNFSLILDTTGPASPSIKINNNSTYATDRLVEVTISVGDGVTSGYQMKIWGDIDGTYNLNYKATRELSSWVAFSTGVSILLSLGDGNKTLSVVVRDDVYNESAQVSDSITLDTTRPTVTITGPDVSKISVMAGKNQSAFSFTVTSTPDSYYLEYKIKVVASVGATHDTGIQIPTTMGSTNMNGIGSYPCETPINCTINGSDLETASSGDGNKIIKVFVRDQAQNWSV